MRMSRWRPLVVLSLLLFCNAASAYYDPNSGRWLSRDPIGEQGFERSRNINWEIEVEGEKPTQRKSLGSGKPMGTPNGGNLQNQMFSVAYHAYFREVTLEVNRLLLTNPALKPNYLFVMNRPISVIDSIGLDSPGCDGIPDWMETKCMLKCCARHDKCYHDNRCTACSWYWTKPFSACDRCNQKVIGCMSLCPWPRDPTAPLYYCAVHDVFFSDPNSPHMQHHTP